MNSIQLVCLLHARLLLLYPARYRSTYTEERQAVFLLAAEEAAGTGRGAFLFFAFHELIDLPFAALMEHLHERRWLMIASLRTLLTEKPDRWGSAVLAGLPHFLSASFYFFPYMFAVYTTSPSAALLFWCNWMMRFPLTHWALTLVAPESYWFPHRVLFQTLQWFFGGLVLLMILFGWMGKWQRWSASWIGYGLIVLLRSLISLFPQDMESLVSILIWLVVAVIIYISLTRRSPLMGLLALLPFYPMFSWWLGVDGIKGTYPEAIGYLTAAALMSLAVAVSARSGSFKLALILLSALIVVAGGGFAYGTVYYSNMPVPEEPTFGRVVFSTLGGFLALALLGLPVWGAIAWKAYRRRKM